MFYHKKHSSKKYGHKIKNNLKKMFLTMKYQVPEDSQAGLALHFNNAQSKMPQGRSTT